MNYWAARTLLNRIQARGCRAKLTVDKCYKTARGGAIKEGADPLDALHVVVASGADCGERLVVVRSMRGAEKAGLVKEVPALCPESSTPGAMVK